MRQIGAVVQQAFALPDFPDCLLRGVPVSLHVIVLLPTVWAIGLSQQVDQLQGLTSIFHSDRGPEYTSAACIDVCEQLGLRRSMGRTGSCLDNAVAESYFATLKVELVDRHHYRTRAQARASIFRWIAWYNRRRLHSTNDYLPPIEWE
jgi:transposase InsO family protein